MQDSTPGTVFIRGLGLGRTARWNNRIIVGFGRGESSLLLVENSAKISRAYRYMLVSGIVAINTKNALTGEER